MGQYAKQDVNRNAASLLHTGTADTADTVRWVGESNGAADVHVAGGTVTSSITFPDPVGSVVVTVGTITTGSLTNVANLLNGTVVVPSGTITTGSLTNVANLLNGTVVLPSGTITTGSLTNVANLLNGTVVVPSGTVTTGSLTNLANLINGSVVMTVGTLTTGSLTNVANVINGSINVLTGTIQSSGTTTGVGVVTTVTTVSNLTIGSVRMTVGTLTTGSLTNLASLHTGTITTGSITDVAKLYSGTINVGTFVNNGGSLGTLNSGTVKIDKNPVSLGTPFHTRGTTGAAVWGTIIAASGAGTYQYVSNIDVVVTSGTVDVAVTNIGIGGSTGAGVLTRGQYPAGGGIAKQFDPVIKSGTNGTLAYWLGGAGTVDINVTYWQGV